MTELSPASSAVSAARGAPARGSLRELVLLAAPLALMQLSQILMGIVDAAFVGRLGAAELGATAFANIWSWMIFSLFFGAASVVQTFVAQSPGAGEERRCGQGERHATACLQHPADRTRPLPVRRSDHAGWQEGPKINLSGAFSDVSGKLSAVLRGLDLMVSDRLRFAGCRRSASPR